MNHAVFKSRHNGLSPVSTSRVWRVMETGHPSTRAVNSGRQLGYSGNRPLQLWGNGKSYGIEQWCSTHHHLRVVLTDRCAVPWPLKISVLHRDESGIALASAWTRLSQVRRGRPGGLVQLDDGFLPSWLFTIKSKALFAGTSGSKRATWPKRDRRRLRRISLIVDRPVLWSTSALVIWSHQWMLSICRSSTNFRYSY